MDMPQMIISLMHGGCGVGRGMYFPFIIIKERPTGPIDIVAIPVVSGILTITGTDTIHTLTATIGTPTPTMAATCGPGSLFWVRRSELDQIASAFFPAIHSLD